LPFDGRPLILVVDDDPGHVELIRRNIRRSGIEHEVQSLPDGHAALDYAFERGQHAGRPKRRMIMLLDLKMPGTIDGVEVLRRIKSHPEKSKIPVIVLSTMDDQPEVERCYALGCNLYLAKPVDPADFLDAMQTLGKFLRRVSLPA
jgi:CheY-like chemotaxis protein